MHVRTIKRKKPWINRDGQKIRKLFSMQYPYTTYICNLSTNTFSPVESRNFTQPFQYILFTYVLVPIQGFFQSSCLCFTYMETRFNVNIAHGQGIPPTGLWWTIDSSRRPWTSILQNVRLDSEYGDNHLIDLLAGLSSQPLHPTIHRTPP